MCGIGGIWGRESEPTQEQLVHQLNAFQHRGPDGQGVLKTGLAGFTHARLSIQDFTEAGHQPFERKGRVLVYNGEVYNFPELKDYLRQKYSIDFHGTGDTEVLFWGLFHEGVSFVSRLNGDFSFIWYDPDQKKMFLVRDRLGVKPLYYRMTKEHLLISSEIRGLFLRNESPELCLSSMNSLLALRYVRGESTIFNEVFRVMPGHIVTIDQNFGISKHKYWCPLDSTRIWSFEEVINTFKDSVRLRLRSQVPVGVLLSGGMDSTLVARVAVEENSQKITHAFTCEITESKSSRADSKAASHFCRNIGLNQVRYLHVRDDFQMPLRAIEEPIGDSIISPLAGLIESASKSVKVVLSGEGADEIFAGYGHHYFLAANFNVPRPIALLGSFILPALKFLDGDLLQRVYPASLGAEEIQRIKNSVVAGPKDFARSYHSICDVFDAKMRREIMGSHFIDIEEETREMMTGFSELDPLKKLLYLELKSWLPNYNLLKLDKLTGWNGIEARVPYLDHRLVELMFSCPSEMLIGLLERKPLIRDMCDYFNISKTAKVPFTYKTPQGKYKDDFKFRHLPLESAERYTKGAGFLAGKRRDLVSLINLWEQGI